MVSVIMPVFNSEDFIAGAVRSILSQTYPDFELIVIDDGSMDATATILGSFHDSRLQILTNDVNRGIVESLNRGLRSSTGEYVARMDADDESLPERLERQVAYLEKYRDVAMVGTAVSLIDEQGATIGREEFPLADATIRKTIFVHNPFCHGSVLIRREVLQRSGGYDGRFVHNEDYDLWLRIGAQHRLANLPDTLLRRRIHGGNITSRLETELTAYRIRTLGHAIVSYYRNPFYAIYMIRPILAYAFRRLRQAVAK
jgi:glycosyltransferase involved in cell wall biosynthesis